MKRRDFIKRTALLAAATGVGEVMQASGKAEQSIMTAQDETAAKASPNAPLIASAPVLQNYASTSIGVAFAVSALANGYVIYGERPDLSDGKKVKCGGFRVTDISDKVIHVRLTDLKPSTTYYYRIGADRIEYKGGYGMKVTGNEEDRNIYHFTTAGKQTTPHFCVINDTHVHWDTMDKLTEKIAALAPTCVIWNGDASNTQETIESQIDIFITPKITRKDYAAQTPYLFCPGNHDNRGFANRHLERVWMYRQPEERLSRDWDLGRNFAVRIGDVALVGLDTAEDKMDTNPKFAGLFNSEAYRKAQTDWLKNALIQEEIAKAPYLVAICHIPLFDPNPKHNPGDVAPDDYDPKYTTDYAEWQRTCARMWCPLLEKVGCQLVITAHQHRYHYDAPTAERPWGHMVGGGPTLSTPDKPTKDYPTVMDAKVENGELKITVYNIQAGTVQDTQTFKPRKIKKVKFA